jgi:hypothetical protein
MKLTTPWLMHTLAVLAALLLHDVGRFCCEVRRFAGVGDDVIESAFV